MRLQSHDVMSGLGLGGRRNGRLRRVKEEAGREMGGLEVAGEGVLGWGRRERGLEEGSQAELASAFSVSFDLGPRG